MSKCHKDSVTCPRCKSTGDFIVWDSINVDIDEDLREKVKDKSVFNYTCPKCGASYGVDYTTLYHDCKNQFMIYYISGNERTKKEKIQEINKEVNPMSRFLKDYTLRIVYKKNDLIDKITVLEEGEDDIIIDILKLLVVSKIPREKQDKFEGIYYLERDRKNYIFQILYKDGSETAAVPKKAYKGIAKEGNIRYPEEFEEVNIFNVSDFIEDEE